MTTTMYAPHIWGFSVNDEAMKTARAMGWRRRDLLWERLQERGNAAWYDGRPADAARDFGCALLVSRFLPRGDPRIATSLANAALADRQRGRTTRGTKRLARARTLWRQVPAYLEDLHIRPRARSSLFHLRMEAKHWETYKANTKTRLGKFVAEADACLSAVAAGAPLPHRLYPRWRGEKPSVYDDTRKILGAALLICAEVEGNGIASGSSS